MEKFETYDVWLSAYLQLTYHSPELHLRNQKVTFVFPLADELYVFLTEFNRNADVPVAD